ncbi:dicarboxylate/amino acid:cation symporter [Planctomicrobium piriforme]|uniref:Na+/H+-dicarboxylate symporter n=1 Tax=Planctomicrobium piriforme TaxID=1576369 RepID=A0A1I3B1T9_9PLAN|nr:dicarboxylate/amino acid:cation symporter [Planctomicrobium piriforme]SFH56162.1 Na+/H+-dicarboxylate symporter [Planctomicrobium piriforme]
MMRVLRFVCRSLYRVPLPGRVLIGVLLGLAVGFTFRQREMAFGWTTADFGVLAGQYVQLLTALATPLIFFAIIDAFVRTEISGRQGVRMIVICLGNVAVAFAIGLTILNYWHPGESWKQRFAEPAPQSVSQDAGAASAKAPKVPETKGSLSPLDLMKSYVPKSIAHPFLDNMVLTVAVLAIFIGLALRTLRSTEDAELVVAITTFDQFIIASFQIVLKLLLWLIELAPIAIFLAVANVIGASGWATFQMMGVFLLTVCAGLAIHSLIYYPLSIWVLTGRRPSQFFGQGGGAILTGLSLNSSLATAPLTLEALRRMGVSDSSARLSACVGTNFNNDGVTLYEAITALFVAQAIGLEMQIGEQLAILLAALVGSMGIAGIPNSGLIILALVLKAAKLPEQAIEIAIPLVYSVDFLVARLRSAVNVMGDLQVAILLDGPVKTEEPKTLNEAEA